LVFFYILLVKLEIVWLIEIRDILLNEEIEHPLLLLFGSLHSFGSNNVYSIFAAAVALPWLK